MRWLLAILTVPCLFISLSRGDEPLSPDGTPLRLQRGLIIARQGNQTTIALGGGLLPRKVKIVTQTPEGPIVTRFTLPSDLHGGAAVVPLPNWVPAFIRVTLPDGEGHLYVEEERLGPQGTTRQLQSPPLQPGQSYTVRLRAGWQVGDRILIEEKQVVLRAGENNEVKFDGRQAVVVSATAPR